VTALRRTLADERALHLGQLAGQRAQHPAELGELLAQLGQPQHQDAVAAGGHRRRDGVHAAEHGRHLAAQAGPRLARGGEFPLDDLGQLRADPLPADRLAVFPAERRARSTTLGSNPAR
jgi:hypothetical protein